MSQWDEWWDEVRKPPEPGAAADWWPFDGRAPQVSATDLLVSWRPNSAGTSGQPPDWDRFFAVEGDPEPEPVPAAPMDDLWDAAAADEAIDTLFRFLHALERADIADAMICIAEHYHHLEDDCEVDRDRLRLRLEALADSWVLGETSVALTEPPRPVFHPEGLLMRVTIQVDYRRRTDSRLICELLPRLVVMTTEAGAGWTIAALSPLR